jgi:hypothetical protein
MIMTVRRAITCTATVALVSISSLSLRADVRADEKTRFEFAGMLGKFVNMFGGKGAREGVMTTIAIKGDRAARMNEENGQIIDLAEEKIYDVDVKKKTYKVTTFAELRRRMEEARKKAQEDAAKAEGKAAEKPESQEKEPQVEVDVNLKNTGEKKTINGYDTQQELLTITVREKGKTLEQGGGMVLTSDLWITPRIAAMKEIQDFYARYAQKLYGSPMLAGVQADQMAAIMGMYPMMKQAIGRMNTEGERVQGTPILTTLTFEGVKSEEQMTQDTKQSDADSKKTPTSVGGLLGGFAKKAAAKKAGGDEGNKQRATVLTGTTEVLKVVTDVSAADVAVPAGFKESR